MVSGGGQWDSGDACAPGPLGPRVPRITRRLPGSEGPPVTTGTSPLTSLQLSCQHAARLRFNEEKTPSPRCRGLRNHLSRSLRRKGTPRRRRASCWSTWGGADYNLPHTQATFDPFSVNSANPKRFNPQINKLNQFGATSINQGFVKRKATCTQVEASPTPQTSPRGRRADPCSEL